MSSSSQQTETCCKLTTPWYMDKKFQRYWSHWDLVYDWYAKHMELVRREKNEQWQAFYTQWWQSVYQKYFLQHLAHSGNHHQNQSMSMPPPRTKVLRKNKSTNENSCHNIDETNSHLEQHFHSHRDQDNPRPRHHPQVYDSSSKRKSSVSRMFSSDSSVSGMSVHGSNVHRKKKKRSKKKRKRVSEEEQYEMEITQEMMDFFEKSALHKKEREKERSKEDQSEEYLDLSELNIVKTKGILPPSERPGARRTTEMKYLYGKEAALIHGMETAVQMNFDRNCDLTAAKPWPHIPLKIQFS